MPKRLCLFLLILNYKLVSLLPLLLFHIDVLEFSSPQFGLKIILGQTKNLEQTLVHILFLTFYLTAIFLLNITTSSQSSAEVKPRNYSEAVKNTRWVEAMQAEIQALDDSKTWLVVPLPLDKRSIGCKWVFKIKYKATGEVERFNARLVAKEYSQ